MRHVHLLIKPASGLCNLNCRYCFYHDIVEKREQASYGLMTEDTLATVLEKALAAASHSCTIAFQGGEPTLAGLDFFRKAVELQRRLNVNRVQVYNSIQTNGLLLDSQWAAFFRENHFLNRYRKWWKGHTLLPVPVIVWSAFPPWPALCRIHPRYTGKTGSE